MHIQLVWRGHTFFFSGGSRISHRRRQRQGVRTSWAWQGGIQNLTLQIRDWPFFILYPRISEHFQNCVYANLKDKKFIPFQKWIQKWGNGWQTSKHVKSNLCLCDWGWKIKPLPQIRYSFAIFDFSILIGVDSNNVHFKRIWLLAVFLGAPGRADPG